MIKIFRTNGLINLNMFYYLSDYYGYEPFLGQVIKFKSLTGKLMATFTLKSLCEGDCSRYHCSHCAGWLIENVPDKYFATEHREAVKCGDAREYYDGDVYHEEEADEILANLLASGKYVHES